MENNWPLVAVGAAVLYGLHQVFTKLASSGIGEGLGGLIVEITAALVIGVYILAQVKFGAGWGAVSRPGVLYSILTGICVGAGTILFFILFKKGGPLSAVPAILALGSALMAVAGVVAFKEKIDVPRLAGIVMSIVSLYLLKK